MLSRLFRKQQTGQSLVILALGFVGLLAVVGITTDVSILFARYAQLRRAVDSASIAAAGQMREDRDIATVNLTARQFIEMHGLNPRSVFVDTCENLRDANNPAAVVDDEVCPPDDSRKLVRVTAQVESPTVFLQFVGWDNLTLEASAISETAVLDVVLILDVSESMLQETNYLDWGSIGQGYAYRPPRLDNANPWVPETMTASDKTVFSEMLMTPSNTKGFIPVDGPFMYDHDGKSGTAEISTYWPTFTGRSNSNETWNQEWFWQQHLLGVPQEKVNQRLYYPPETPTATASEAGAAEPKNPYYEVRTFIPSDVKAEYGTSNQHQPREACRVRFYPYSYTLDVPQYDLNLYKDDGAPDWPKDPTSGKRKWRGFVPTYNFFGCCNDPGGGTINNRGVISPSGPSDGGNWNQADGNFSDLICQPFKQARDATRLFLERIDFERGDRVAFVTFDRSAYLIDPDGENGNQDHMIAPFDDPNLGRISARSTANNLLNESIGVRAEPNFYVWNENGGGWVDANGNTQYAQGIDRNTGKSIPIDYYSTTAMHLNNYPVAGNCYYGNAALKYPITRYANRGTASKQIPPDHPNSALSNMMTPDIYDDPWWSNIRTNGWSGSVVSAREPNITGTIAPGSLEPGDNAYELWASCRGTNMGAALREGSNALTTGPRVRREGTVWIMILLSDGAAGASDPARIHGVLPNTPDPYQVGTDTYNPSDGTGERWYGLRGQYGFYGVCPPGGFETSDNVELMGELMLTSDPPNEPVFPFCSDERPHTRHFCLPKVQAQLGVNSSVGRPNFEAGFGPGAQAGNYDNSESPEWNADRGRVFDIDIGNYGNEPACDILYDVDDYARDWSDFVSGIAPVGKNQIRDAVRDDAVLPIVFTIGFGLDFIDTNGDGVASGQENVEEWLGEELLRYIADAGDNFFIDNDYQQDYRHDRDLGTADSALNNGEAGYGVKDPCQDPDVDYVPGDRSTIAQFTHGESCGNYFNAPGEAELNDVFDEIASRMFTRLAG